MPDELATIDRLDVHQRKYISHVLQSFSGNRVAAAKALGISLRGLQYIIARWRRAGHPVPESQHPRARKLAWLSPGKTPPKGREGA